MRISDSQCDETALARMGAKACELITKGDYRELADRFGYALAFGKEPAEAIRVDAEACPSRGSVSGQLVVSGEPAIRVGFFKPDDAPFFAVVKCQLGLTCCSGNLEIDLIVTTNGNERHVTLEEISHRA